MSGGFPGGASGNGPACQCRRYMRCRFNPWVWKISWRRAWQPTPVFLPGRSQGQRSLSGYSLWNFKRVRHDWSDLACMLATCQDEPWSSKTFYSQSGLGTSSIGKELVRHKESQNLKYSSEPLDEDLHFKKPPRWSCKEIFITDEFRIDKQSLLKEKIRQLGSCQLQLLLFSRACLLRNGNPWRVFDSMLFIAWHS